MRTYDGTLSSKRTKLSELWSCGAVLEKTQDDICCVHLSGLLDLDNAVLWCMKELHYPTYGGDADGKLVSVDELR